MNDILTDWDLTRVEFERRQLHWKALGLGIILAGLLVSSSAAAQEATPQAPNFSLAKQATVFLMQTYTSGDSQAISCVGSGTLISSDGLILTNAHLVVAEGPCKGDTVVVALPTRPDEPPVPTFVATIVQLDMQLDLAILQITGGLDSSPIAPGTLSLPFVQIGDPSPLLPGNTLTFIGYPDIASSPITEFTGLINGVTAEKSASRQAWLRIDAPLAGGLSGGGAYDANGLLVGIPTGASASDGSTPGPTCLSIQDNTQDGLITEQDACVPIGAPISQIRPINFAGPLIESARRHLKLDNQPGLPDSVTIEQPSFSRLFFSAQIDPLGIPSRIVSTAPTGTTSLFLFFDYRNMRPGLPYALRVAYDGLEMPQLTLGPLAWGGGAQGTWYIGTENLSWPDGNYEFTLEIAGQPVAAQSITIGGSPTEPIFSDLTFGIPDPAGGFSLEGTLLPSQTPEIDVEFNYENMTVGQEWTDVWLLEGTDIWHYSHIWDGPQTGQTRIALSDFAGLPLGRYRLELYIGTRLAATGDVHLAGTASASGAPEVFQNDRIASGISRDGQPTGQTGSILPLGTTSIYAFVDWDYLPLGIPWTYRWYLDGQIVASRTQPWDEDGIGRNYWMSLSSPTPLPEGTYAVEVVVGELPLFSSIVSIGSGTQPTTGLQGASSDVFVSGTVIDAVTGDGIPGALIFVLDVSLVSAQFTWDESEIYTQVITDENGQFSFPRGLPRGQYYTVYVMADGYLTVLEDNFWVLKSQTSPVDIVVEMSPAG
jgi:S1-C subfamily serine protease